jgi:NDP-sugar pyrophosphorylase family protein
LAALLPAPPGEKVLVLNADAFIDVDLNALIAADRPEALATLVLQSAPDAKDYGVLGTDAADRITDFAGRARVGDVVKERMFCGVHLVHPRAFSILPAVHVEGGVATGPVSGINDEGYPEWLRRGEQLYAFDTAGTFCDVGTPERLRQANQCVLDGVWASDHVAPFQRFRERAPRVFVSPLARVDAGATLVAPVVIDDEVVIEAGAHVQNAIVGKRHRVRAGERVVGVALQSVLSGRPAPEQGLGSVG